jgi:Tfp pilus assembly protein PilN
VRAVNLMPGEDRAARAGRPAGSGGVVYVLLAGLAVMVALAGLWASSSSHVAARRATLAEVVAEARAAEARATRLAPYQAFATLAHARVSTVRWLSATRFDWAHGLHELSRVLPADVWLSSLDGSSGATGEAPSTTASAAPRPTFEFVGCTGSQAKVARLMARLRAADGVRDVRLQTSEKPDGAGDEDCPANGAGDPAFAIAIAFKAPGAARDAVDATGQVVARAAAPAGGGAAPPAVATDAPSTPATSER